MSEMDAACREVMGNVDGAVACGMVDLVTFELIGFHAIERTPALAEAVRQATLTLLRRGDAESACPTALEAHVISEQGYHFAKVLEGKGAAVMLVARRAPNAGMGSAQINAVIPKVEPYVP